LLLSKEKQERAEKRAGASLATGVSLGALNEARNLTQPTATPQKEHEQSQHKIKKQSTITEGVKTLHTSISHWNDLRIFRTGVVGD
jgi:hypothetical protein